MLSNKFSAMMSQSFISAGSPKGSLNIRLLQSEFELTLNCCDFELEDMEHKISDTAFNVFDEVRLQGEHTDVVIKVQGKNFKVHKIILCGCSPYFR